MHASAFLSVGANGLCGQPHRRESALAADRAGKPPCLQLGGIPAYCLLGQCPILFTPKSPLHPSESCWVESIPYCACSQLWMGPCTSTPFLCFMARGPRPWLMVRGQVVRSSCNHYSSWSLDLWWAGPDILPLCLCHQLLASSPGLPCCHGDAGSHRTWKAPRPA